MHKTQVGEGPGHRACLRKCGTGMEGVALFTLWTALRKLCGCVQGVEGRLARLGEEAQELRYIVGLDLAGQQALVVLREDAGCSDILAAYVYGYMLLHSEALVVCGPLELGAMHATVAQRMAFLKGRCMASCMSRSSALQRWSAGWRAAGRG